MPSRRRFPCGIALERAVGIDVSSAKFSAKSMSRVRISVRNPIFRCSPLRWLPLGPPGGGEDLPTYHSFCTFTKGSRERCLSVFWAMIFRMLQREGVPLGVCVCVCVCVFDGFGGFDGFFPPSMTADNGSRETGMAAHFWRF